MSERPNIPNAPPHLRDLLLRLHRETGLTISQHEPDPQLDEWYAGMVRGGFGGDVGPERSAEDALVAGIKWLVTRLAKAEDDRDQAEAEVQALRQQVHDQADDDQADGLDPWRKALES